MKVGVKAKKYLVNRSTYKTIKKFDHEQMERFLTNVYLEGVEEGNDLASEPDAKQLLEMANSEQRTMMQAIELGLDASKGVGDKLKARIIENIKAARQGAIGNEQCS